MAISQTVAPYAAGTPEKRSDGMPHVFARDQWNYTIVDLSADAAHVIYNGTAELGHIYVDAALSAHACPVQDANVTGFSLVASLAAGTAVTFCKGMRFETRLQIDSNDAATGTIVVMWRPI